MKLSVWIVARFDDTRANLILGERVFDLGEGMSLGCHASVAQIVAISARRFRPECESLGYFRANVLEELWHDRETSNEDTN